MSKIHTNYTIQIYIKSYVTVIIWSEKKYYTCEEKRKGKEKNVLLSG